MNRLMPFAAVLVLSLAACDRDERRAADAPHATAPAAADKDAVKKLETDFLAALKGKNWDAVKASYAPNAVMVLPEMAPMKGAAVIGAEYDKFAGDPAGKFEGTNEATEVGADMAYSHGSYAVSYTNSQTNKVETGQGYYLIVYRKQDDGSWKIVQDVSSPTPKPS